MSDFRVGSLVIGINNYQHEYYRRGQYELMFAEADAVAFHKYLAAAWTNSPKDNHIILCNEKVEFPRIESSLVELAGKGPFNQFFFYFAGHGEKNDQSAWLCAADAQPGQISLEINKLDELLSSIKADVVLLFLDCCYAESIISKSNFLNRLDDSQARLFVCSARGSQQTWEEAKLGHGIFSYLLISALSKGTSVSQNGNFVDVEKELFPYLCEQVPLAVIKYKRGNRQEPVKGGISRSEVKLPVAATGVGGISSSIYDVVKRRYRQVLAITLASLLIIFLLIQVFFYHLAIDSTGRVVVRYGVRETFGFLPSAFGIRNDAGFDAAALSAQKTPKNLAQLSRLQDGQVWGVWTQNSIKGYRSWIDVITPFLKESERERAFLLLSGDLSPDMYAYLHKSLNQNEGEVGAWLEVESWRTKLVAESLLLNAENKTERARWLLLQIPKLEGVELHSSAPPTNVMDFTVTNLSSTEVVEHITALKIYSAAEPTIRMDAFQDVLKLVSYRALSSKNNEETRKEFLALSDLFRALSISRQAAGQNSIATEEAAFLNHCLEFWCAPATSVVISRMGSSTDQTNNLRHLETVLKNIDSVNQEIKNDYSLWSIGVLAEANLINSDFAGKIFETAQRVYGFTGLNDPWRILLVKVAASAALPKMNREALFQLLEGNEEEDSFSALTAFLILSANYKFLDENEKNELKTWFEPRAKNLRTLSIIAPAFSALAINGIQAPEIASLLNERLMPELKIYSDSENLKPGFLNIISDDYEHAKALAKIAQQTELAEEIRNRLYLFAVNRPDFAESDELFKGLAAQRAVYTEQFADSLHDSITRFPTDYYRRRVETQIAVEQILRIPFSERNQTIDEILELWKNENEPDVKILLANVLLQTKQV